MNRVAAPLLSLDDDGWLDDSEEQMRAEDVQWEEAFVHHQETFSALEAAARAEIAQAIAANRTELGRRQTVLTQEKRQK